MALSLSLVLAPAASVSAQGRPQSAAAVLTGLKTVRAAAVGSFIAVDGNLDEPAWALAEAAVDFIQLEPRPGEPSAERTEARVLFDDDALFVAMRMYDRRPDSIVAQLARRDEMPYADMAWVSIDSYFDRRTAFAFGLNAAGTKVDVRISNDDQRDASWDAVWDGAVRIDSLGWTAEWRIPFSQLRFGAARGTERVWGVNFRRQLARREEVSYWAPVPPNSNTLVSNYGELRGLPAVRPPRHLEVLPYTVGRFTRAPGDANDPYWRANDVFGSAGADVRAGLPSGLTLTATANPDFGQVEADPSEVNLSAYESFFEEKRPFFVEGAELFQVEGPATFYSRRIGRAPQGRLPADAGFADVPESSTILAAAKLSGKTSSGWSVGVLDALTSSESARYSDLGGQRRDARVEPLTNYVVARLARDFRRGRSTLGTMFTGTHRQLDEPALLFLRSAAYTLGVDARHRFDEGRYEVAAAAIASRIEGDTSAIARVQRGAGHYFQRPDAEHVAYDPARTSLGGMRAAARIARVSGGNWRWGSTVVYLSPGFEINDLGFNPFGDRIEQFVGFDYQNSRPAAPFRSWSAGVNEYSEHTTGRELLDLHARGFASATLTNGWGAYTWGMRHHAGVTADALRGGPSLRRPDRWMGGGNVFSDRRKRVSASAGVFWAAEDGDESRDLSLNAGVTARPSARVSVSLSPSVSNSINTWQYVSRETVGGQPHYVLAHLDQRTAAMSIRLSYTVAANLSFQLYAQPFVSAGEYSDFKGVVRPGAARFADQFHAYAGPEIRTETTTSGTRRHRIDADRDGRADFTIDDPSFNFKQVRSNAVLRWEYRPGSTLFLVWSQDRTGFDAGDGTFSLGRDVANLLDAPGRNVLLVKASYWLGL